MIAHFSNPRNGWLALAALAFWLAASGMARADEPPAEPATRLYIVQLRDPPAITAARPTKRLSPGQKFDATAEAVRSYAAAQVERHDELLRSVGAPDAKVYSYRLSFNGFAARLTAAQAATLSEDPAVARVWEDRARNLKTNASAGYLGLLDAPDGLRVPLGLKGEDIVIGVIDSGIATGHPSFADTEPVKTPRACRSEWSKTALLGRWLCKRFRGRKNQVYSPLSQWQGRCEAGEGFAATDCNNKLIGARFYVDGFQAGYDMDENEFLSPRDADGHGTHIASVAAGNTVRASLGGTEVATISGIAPRARIAVYKACWLEPGAVRATCAMSDLQRAIEDAVADGVDIINYSVGTSDGGPTDPDALALLAASDAGVLAVVAAGNSGPLAGGIDSPGSSPWVLTVGGASRAGKRFDDAVRITAPSAAAGEISDREAAFTPSLGSSGPVEGKLVLAEDSVDPTDDACEALQNGSDVQGKIALIRRGTCPFEEKISNAQDAGATAAIVFSDEDAPFTMTGERGSVDIPAVMISKTDGEALAARLADGDTVELRLDKRQHITRTDSGNVLFGKSSRGPNLLLPDVLKPDVVAPGTDILGAQTSVVANGVRGEVFQYLSGTSMAVPHVAGAAALLMEAHPDWSPAAIRSALVTTARPDVYREDGSLVDAFDAGGGYIVPSRANAPGLVYDAGREDYDAFACGVGIPRVTEEECVALAEAGYPTTVDDLNLPSITVSDLVSARAVRRSVTNLGPAAMYQANFSAPPGISVSVSPATLAIGAGETAEFTVDLRNLGDPAALDDWQFGALTWVAGNQQVRTPLAVHAQRLAVPEVVTGTGGSSSTSFEVAFGYNGTYEASSTGLVAPTTYTGTVLDDPLNLYTIQPDDSALPDHVRRFRFSVPAGTTYLRVALAPANPDSTDDLDLYMICPDSLCQDGSEALAAATSATSDEVIGILDPDAGEYVLDVHGFETRGGIAGAGADFVLRAWTIGNLPGEADLAVSAPVTASVGASAEVSLSWQDLAPGEIYAGLISHSDGEAERALTLIEVVSE